MSSGRSWITALLAMLVALGALATNVVLPASGGAAWHALLNQVPSLAFVIVGALLLARRVGHGIGALLALTGLLFTTGAASTRLTVMSLRAGAETDPSLLLAAWYAEWYWIPALYLLLVYLPALVPDGRPSSKRWQVLLRLAGVTMALSALAAMLQRDLLAEELRTPLRNPIGLLPWSDVDLSPVVLIIVFTIVVQAFSAVVSQVLRFRRARGLERQQLKVILFAVAVTVTTFGLLGPGEALFGGQLSWLEPLVPVAIPLGIFVAVTRHRLYGIDRVISRSVSWLLLTVVLVGVYVGMVVVLQGLLSPVTGESDLAVAGATLAVAALFTPVRRRVQAVVDRRFHRARYDAERIVAAFRERLRDEVDLEDLHADLLATIGVTVHPTRASLWLRRERAGTDRSGKPTRDP